MTSTDTFEVSRLLWESPLWSDPVYVRRVITEVHKSVDQNQVPVASVLRQHAVLSLILTRHLLALDTSSVDAQNLEDACCLLLTNTLSLPKNHLSALRLACEGSKDDYEVWALLECLRLLLQLFFCLGRLRFFQAQRDSVASFLEHLGESDEGLSACSQHWRQILDSSLVLMDELKNDEACPPLQSLMLSLWSKPGIRPAVTIWFDSIFGEEGANELIQGTLSVEKLGNPSSKTSTAGLSTVGAWASLATGFQWVLLGSVMRRAVPPVFQILNSQARNGLLVGSHHVLCADLMVKVVRLESSSSISGLKNQLLEMKAVGLRDWVSSTWIPALDGIESYSLSTAVLQVLHPQPMLSLEDSRLRAVDSSSFVEEKVKGFVGRASLFDRLENWRVSGQWQLKDGSLKATKLVVVTGDPGIGKSSFLSALVSKPEPTNTVAAYHFCRYDVPESLEAQRWKENVGAQLLEFGRQHGLTIDKCLEAEEILVGQSVPDVDKWKRFLQLLDKNVPFTASTMLLVIDSLDEALDYGGSAGEELVRTIARSCEYLPSWLKLVVSSRNDGSVLDLLKSTHPGVLEIKSDDEENLSDLKEYVVVNKSWDESNLTHLGDVTDVIVEEVVRVVDGNFMIAVQFLSHNAAVDAELLFKGGIVVPTGLYDFYSAMTQRLWGTKEKFLEVLPMLNVLAAARAPIPRDLFDAAMNQVGFGTTTVTRLLQKLSSVIDVSNRIVRIYHKSFGDWLAEKGWTGGNYSVPVDMREGHDKLAKACCGLWATGGKGYAIEWLCYHTVEGSGSTDVFRDVVSALGGVDSLVFEDRTLMYAACFEGRLDVVRILVKVFKSKAVDTPRNDGITPLWIACQNGHADVVRALVNEFGSKAVDVSDKYGHTPLWTACLNGHVDVVRILVNELMSKAVDTPDENGGTCLSVACFNGRVDIVRVLVNEFGSKAVDTPNKYGATPLQSACSDGHVEMVRILVKEFYSKAVDTPDKYGRTPLHVACQNGHVKMVRILVNELGSQAVDSPDKFGATPLWTACENGHVDVVRVLVNELKSKTLDTPDNVFGWSPLYAACIKGHVDVARVLLNHFGCTAVESPNEGGLTPLYVACKHGHVDVVRVLVNELKSKAVDRPDKYGETPLYVACKHGHVDIVRILVTEFRSKAVDTTNQNGKTPLYAACKNGHVDVVRILVNELKSNVVVTPDQHRWTHGWTCLYVACREGHVDVVRVLLNHFGSTAVDSPSEGGLTPLYVAYKNGHVDVVRVLLNELKSKAVDRPDKYGETPLYVACKNGHVDIARLLVTEFRSKAVDTTNKYGSTPLLVASANGYVNVVRVLVNEFGSTAVETPDNDGVTPLLAACYYGHVDLVRVLLTELGSKAVDTSDRYGRTPLHVACQEGHGDIARLLVYEGNSKAVDSPDKDGTTPLWIASKSGHSDIVRMLVKEFGSKSLETPNKTGRIPAEAALDIHHYGVGMELELDEDDPFAGVPGFDEDVDNAQATQGLTSERTCLTEKTEFNLSKEVRKSMHAAATELKTSLGYWLTASTSPTASCTVPDLRLFDTT